MTSVYPGLCSPRGKTLGTRLPGPGFLARNQHRVSGDQYNSVDSSGQLGSTACNLDVQLCRHGPATVLIEFLNNRLCHSGLFG